MNKIKKERKPKEPSNLLSILRYQLFTKLWLLAAALAFNFAQGSLLWNTDRSAITSGDLRFLTHSVQGWVLMLLGFAILIVYVVVDINAMIILSHKLLHKEKIRIFKILREAFYSLRYFMQPIGLAFLLYVAFLVPIVGSGLGISVTKSFYIPDFILSVIKANKLYYAIYILLIVGIFAVGRYFIFTFHYMVLGKQNALAAFKSAGNSMKKNWKSISKALRKFTFRAILTIGLVVLLAIIIIIAAVIKIDLLDQFNFRVFICFCAYLCLAIVNLNLLLFHPYYMLSLTKVYELTVGEFSADSTERRKRNILSPILISFLVLFLVIFVSLGSAVSFEEMFPPVGDTKIIAHRAGGELANENTILALNKAVEAGVYGGEIDVQRTKDGRYVVNHDNNFLRLSGVKKTSVEMTLAEIKSLEVPDNFNPDGVPTEYASFEEMLDAAEGRIHLYVELKGATADRLMADELYEIVKARKMLDQVSFICLDYPVISYMETAHPEADTGYLCFASFGKLENLNVDQLILEEETATNANISAIHTAGKKVSVWTVNDPINMLRFYARNADAIITDDVSSGMNLKEFFLFADKDGNENIHDFVNVLLYTFFIFWP